MSRANVLLAMFLVTFGQGCASQRPIRAALFVSPTLEAESIEPIALLPIVDIRTDKSCSLDFEKTIRQPLAKQLKDKGYDVVLSSTFSVDGAVSMERVAAMNPQELASLGPVEAQSVLLVYLKDIRSDYYVMVYSFKIAATVSLVSRTKRSELWRDKAFGNSGQGGLVSGLMSGLHKKFAVSDFQKQLLKTFPDKTR